METTYLKRLYALNEQGGRDYNEDSIYPPVLEAKLSDRLFMVCDGVGGSANGAVASRLVCASFSRYFTENAVPGHIPDEQFLRNAQEAALAAMQEYVAAHPESAGMGSTLTLACLHDGGALVAWCGDSRIYHLRQGKVLYQSQDHSLVQELVRLGQIKSGETASHPQRNVILRSITAGAAASSIEIHQITDLQPGDFLLLCTDGLMEHVDEKALGEILQSTHGEDLAYQVNRLAYGRTHDNYSMYLLEWGGDVTGGTKPYPKLKAKAAQQFSTAKPYKTSKPIHWALALILLLILFAVVWQKTRNRMLPPPPPQPAAAPLPPPPDTAAPPPSKFRRMEMEQQKKQNPEQ